MASHQTISKVVKQLLAAPLPNKPKTAPGQNYNDWLTDLVNVYADTLDDVDDAALVEATRQHIKTGEWYPSIAVLRSKANSVVWQATENRLTDRPDRSYAAYCNQERGAWPVCPMCEEHSPNVKDCPFCADMKTAMAYNSLPLEAMAQT